MNCGDCIFALTEQVRGPGGDYREISCHRFPPTQFDRAEFRHGWPVVYADQWCGEWKEVFH